MRASRTAYADAGVDVEAGDRAVDLMRERIPRGAGDLLGLGSFAAALELPEGFRHPLLVTSTDGVGTKTEIARRLGRLDTVGQDLVAMCADDVVCHGASPAYFLDYLAVGRVDPERVATLVGGVSDACAEISCSLVGGETAEHPDLMGDDEFDIAGFCIGFVERDQLIDGSDARTGDVVIGLASSGLHANGYSLVRRLVDDGRLPLDETLLTPTKLYANAVLSLLATLRDSAVRVGGLAHVTGGGLPANLPRAVDSSLGIRLQVGTWSLPDVFGRVQSAAGIGDSEMRATFNCGIGFAVVVQPDAGDATIDILAREGVEAWTIGEVRPADDLGARYVEA
ncbi:MAG TPA: phosphoribosylformylglycinamidine cyclo-ligase [Candidatus Limnocylindrales bacterium]|nr:phosphoribosylformylglycinamidine cyclo-ligase [Candidatus Limnocylindrales bacterium]